PAPPPRPLPYTTLFRSLRTGRPREARACLLEALARPALWRERATLRRATNLLGAAHFALGEIDPARRAFEGALAMGRDDGDDLRSEEHTSELQSPYDLV